MSEYLTFCEPRVQSTLLEFSREILMGDLAKGVRDYADFRLSVSVDCPVTTELIHNAIGAEALFAAWRQPIDSAYDNILHIVKVDIEGAIIPGSETMVGSVYEGKVVHCSGEFTNIGVLEVEGFAKRQEGLPWQPDANTGLYALTR